MTLALDASAPVIVKAGPSTNPIATTASFSPPAQSWLVAMVAANNGIASPTTGHTTTQTVASASGTTLTWTRRALVNADNNGGTDGGAELWTAPVATAPGAITIKSQFADVSTTDNGREVNLKVMVLTDSSGVMPLLGAATTAHSTNGTPSTSLTVSANSLVFAVVSDWAAIATAATYPAGMTSISDGSDGNYAWHFWRTTSATAAGSQTMNMSGPAGENYNLAVLEVLQTTIIRRPIVLGSQAAHRAAIW